MAQVHEPDQEGFRDHVLPPRIVVPVRYLEIVREGDLAPDGDGNIAVIFNPSINDNGEVAFKSSLSGTAANDGIFRGSGGPLTQIVRKGQTVAGDGVGTYDLLLSPGVFNDAGQVAFKANLIGTSAGAANNNGIFRGSGGAVTEIVRIGDLGPGADAAIPGGSKTVLIPRRKSSYHG